MLVETDLLLALISSGDKHHSEAVRLFDKYAGKIALSPYSLIELNLLLKSGVVIVEDPSLFYEALGNLMKYRGVGTYPPKAEYHKVAHALRRKYGLSYFDSLHAAVALTEDVELVSYDRVYEAVAEVKYLHPLDLL